MSAAEGRRRFRVDGLAVDADGTLDPGADVQRHLRVLRAAAGDEIWLFDGHGEEVRAEITRLDDAGARVRVIETVRRDVESPLAACLVQAIPVRAARMETIVRQATELGVARIVPVLAKRSQQSKVSAAGRRRLQQRWRRIADGAAEQCGRTRVPRLDDITAYAELDWQGLPRPLLLADPEASLAQAAPRGAPWLQAEGEAPAGVTVMVGPEGGWTEEEVEAARERGALGLRLGPRVLRADTAGTVALSLLQHIWGDLRQG